MKVIKTFMNDDFTCVCGNTASDSGFYPCDKKGKNVEPDHDWENHYKCDGCNQIYLYQESR